MSEITTVTIGGVKYSVTKQMAEKIEEERKANEKKEQETSRKLQELEASVEKIAAQTSPPQQEQQHTGLDYKKVAERFWENPEDAFKEVHDHAVKTVEDKYAKLKKEEKEAEDADKALQQFYDDFYKKNKQFVGEEDLVEGVLSANYTKWKGLSREKVMEELEKSVTAIILRHSKGKAKGSEEEEENAGHDFLVEGQSLEQPEGGARGKKDDEDDDKGKKPKSLSQALKARKAARKKAMGGS